MEKSSSTAAHWSCTIPRRPTTGRQHVSASTMARSFRNISVCPPARLTRCARPARLRKLEGEVAMQHDDLALTSAERLFADLADIQTVIAAKDSSWKDRLWAGVEETGLNVA